MEPLVSYGIRGFLWYQAESSAGVGEDRHKMAAMIFGWRRHWQRLELPCPFHPTPELSPCGGLDSCTRRTAPCAVCSAPSKLPNLQPARVIGADIHFGFFEIKSDRMVFTRRNLQTPKEAADAALRGFELAGSDKVWHAARARIDGETVIVSADAGHADGP